MALYMNNNNKVNDKINDEIMAEPNSSTTYTPTNAQSENLYKYSDKANVRNENPEYVKQTRQVHQSKTSTLLGILAVILGFIIAFGIGYLILNLLFRFVFR